MRFSPNTTGSSSAVISALGELTTTLNKVVKCLEKTESRIQSMEEKMDSTTLSSSASDSRRKTSRKVPVVVRVSTEKRILRQYLSYGRQELTSLLFSPSFSVFPASSFFLLSASFSLRLFSFLSLPPYFSLHRISLSLLPPSLSLCLSLSFCPFLSFRFHFCWFIISQRLGKCIKHSWMMTMKTSKVLILDRSKFVVL